MSLMKKCFHKTSRKYSSLVRTQLSLFFIMTLKFKSIGSQNQGKIGGLMRIERSGRIGGKAKQVGLIIKGSVNLLVSLIVVTVVEFIGDK